MWVKGQSFVLTNCLQIALSCTYSTSYFDLVRPLTKLNHDLMAQLQVINAIREVVQTTKSPVLQLPEQFTTLLLLRTCHLLLRLLFFKPSASVVPTYDTAL